MNSTQIRQLALTPNQKKKRLDINTTAQLNIFTSEHAKG